MYLAILDAIQTFGQDNVFYKLNITDHGQGHKKVKATVDAFRMHPHTPNLVP